MLESTTRKFVADNGPWIKWMADWLYLTGEVTSEQLQVAIERGRAAKDPHESLGRFSPQ